jgi:hypothetical protein
MPVTSEVEICNRALRYIGAEPIVSLDDDGKAENVCQLMYPSARNTLLSRFVWRFAVTRQTLALLPGTTNLTGYTYEYQLPTDPAVMRPLGFGNAANIIGFIEDLDADFIIEGTSIYCDIGSASLRYVGLITDVTKFDDFFNEALARRLAADINPSLGTKDQTTVEQLAELAVRGAAGKNAIVRKRRRSVTLWRDARRQ